MRTPAKLRVRTQERASRAKHSYRAAQNGIAEGNPTLAGNIANVTTADINRFLDGLVKPGPVSKNGIRRNVVTMSALPKGEDGRTPVGPALRQAQGMVAETGDVARTGSADFLQQKVEVVRHHAIRHEWSRIAWVEFDYLIISEREIFWNTRSAWEDS
jgi:hypothetical protein